MRNTIYIIFIVTLFGYSCTSLDQLEEEEAVADQNALNVVEEDVPDENFEEEPDTVDIELVRAELENEFEEKANDLTDFYMLAQRLFFEGNFELALNQINRAAAVNENADVLAMRGNIYFGLGNRTRALENWERAVRLDPSVPFPDIPAITNFLRDNELIDP